LRQRRCGGTSGDVLVKLGVRAIPLGIAAMFLTFVLKSAGTQAGPVDTGSPGSGISVFGTIYPDIFRLPMPPRGSGRPHARLLLASLQPQVGFDASANRFEMLTDTSGSACWNASLDERLAAFDPRPASFWTEDCPASFDERFRSAMPVLASALPSLPDRDVHNQRTDAPKPIVSKAHLFAGQARKEVPPSGDDGRTAIYDITAHSVYLPSGHRLEAHSGLG